MSDERQKRLLTGLIGPYQGLYLNNAYFHNAIHQLAPFVEWLVDGLSVEAEKYEAKAAATLEHLRGSGSHPTRSMAPLPNAPRDC